MDERIKRVMAQTFRVGVDEITDETTPETLAAWDSLQHMNLILALEAEFGTEFDEAVLYELTSLTAIRSALAAKCG